jgi:hypothetical protein
MHFIAIYSYSRSRWPRSVRYVLFSPAQTLGSWVRIPLEARMCVQLFCVCGVLFADSALATG